MMKILLKLIYILIWNQNKKAAFKVKYLKKVNTINHFNILSYSQEQEDLFLTTYFKDKVDGFYVDVGAFDPFTYSNTALLYNKGWSGINIDPSVKSIEEFNKHRTRDININVGAGIEEDELDFYVFDEKSAVNTFSKEAKDFVESVDWGKPLKEVHKVKVKPLAKILDDSMPENQEIDIMDIDVEGLDFEVLKSNNWEKYKPKVILVELGKRESIRSAMNNEIITFLESKDYVLFLKYNLTAVFLSKEECKKREYKI